MSIVKIPRMRIFAEPDGSFAARNRGPAVWCAVCDKPVKNITVVDTVNDRWEPQSWLFVVSCHGETEQVRITAQEVRQATSITVRRAFEGRVEGRGRI